jgi:hypothetical protein
MPKRRADAGIDLVRPRKGATVIFELDIGADEGAVRCRAELDVDHGAWCRSGRAENVLTPHCEAHRAARFP